METDFLWSNLSIADALRKYPDLLPVFLKYHSHCIGCLMASFCSLKQAVRVHRKDSLYFADDINAVIHKVDSNLGS